MPHTAAALHSQGASPDSVPASTVIRMHHQNVRDLSSPACYYRHVQVAAVSQANGALQRPKRA